ncbi:MAG: hypothetical protein NTY22_03825 [Proteobacteria bacterium]|nr:hypothetical protein [Pseudomonadota bacterium]
MKSVYVKNYKYGENYSIYKADEHELPVWCSIKDTYANVVKKFNNDFIKKETKTIPTFLVCYSGNTPVVNTQEIESSNGSVYRKNFQQTPFLQEEFNPYSKLYLIGIVLSGKGKDILPEYFNLYKEFCMEEKTECCMINSGQDMVFNVIIEHPYDLSIIEKTIKNIKKFIDNRGISEDDIKTGFNLFKSTFVDKCSFERWYYDSIYMNIVKPEIFLDYNNWLAYFKDENGQEIKIKGVGIKIIDSKRLSPQDFAALKGTLNRLTGEF